MNRTLLAVLLILLCSAAQTDELVPSKMVVPPVCGFPGLQLPEDTVVLGAGGLGGKVINFQIGQSGNTATQIDVAVNNPEKPVALMLGASEPNIWNISWTEGTNIVAVFVSGNERQLVAGLKTNTPLLISSYEDNGPCNDTKFTYQMLHLHDSFIASFGYGQITDVEQAKVEQQLSQLLYSRPISKIFSVSDGKVMIGDALVSGQQLITSSATPPESFYDKNAPLAGQAGLDDAVSKKILRRATIKDAEKWIKALKRKYAIQNRPPPDIPPDLFNAYVVLKKFTYPAGLHGGHKATFYIPEGVPQPSGNYGHSKVYDFNSITLECRGGGACGQEIMRGEIGFGSTQNIIIIDGGE